MGKDLKGKELGVGISQRKNGDYTARFTTRSGKRVQKYFKKLQDCRNWIAEAQFQDAHNSIYDGANMTFGTLYEAWAKNKSKFVRPQSLNNYNAVYIKHIEEIMGNMIVGEIRRANCLEVIERCAEKGLSASSVNTCKNVIYSVLEYAVEKEIIQSNPATHLKNNGWKKRKISALTKQEQEIFLDAIKDAGRLKNVFLLALQTGMRAGELNALRWEDIDFNNKVIHVQRTRALCTGKYVTNETKTAAGNRYIPLTAEAERILLEEKEFASSLKIVSMQDAGYVFLGKTGKKQGYSSYNSTLYSVVDKTPELGRNVSMHVLRHTFATRCIEAGMQPKTLQTILGHSTIGMTMDMYVSVTNEQRRAEMEEIEQQLKLG